MEKEKEKEKEARVCFVIVSTLVTSAKPLTYTCTRSLYSPLERLSQTVESISSIRSRLPRAHVLVADNSSALPAEFVEALKKVGADEVLTCHGADADSAFKALGESQCTLAALDHLFLNQHQKYQFDIFFKLSGRYHLTERFSLPNYLKEKKKMSFWRNPERTSVNTVLYAVPASLFGQWRAAVSAISTGRHPYLSYEEQMYQIVEGNHLGSYVDVVGVAGLVSVDGTFFDR